LRLTSYSPHEIRATPNLMHRFSTARQLGDSLYHVSA
jgi:hypothetical protein